MEKGSIVFLYEEAVEEGSRRYNSYLQNGKRKERKEKKQRNKQHRRK